MMKPYFEKSHVIIREMMATDAEAFIEIFRSYGGNNESYQKLLERIINNLEKCLFTIEISKCLENRSYNMGILGKQALLIATFSVD